MLRYAVLESSVVASRQNQACRALIVRNRGFSSAHPSSGLNALRKERFASSSEEPKQLSSLEIAFEKRLEQTRLQTKEKRVTAQQQSKNINKPAVGGRLANLKPSFQEGPQQQQIKNGESLDNHSGRHGSASGITTRFGTQQSQTNGRPQQQPLGIKRNQANQNKPQTATTTGALIREMLAQRTSVSPKKPGIDLTEMLKNANNPSNLQRLARPKKPVAPSIREMMAQPTTTASPEKKRDMTDVSDLREAFFKSIQVARENSERERTKEQQNAADGTLKQTQAPAWRKSGAKGFRKRLQEEQREQAEKLEQQRKMRAAVNRSSGAFFMTQEDYIEESKQQQQAAQNDKTVMLPPREVTINELSGLFRVKIDDLTKMLKALGERPQGDNYLVDLDVMELLAMELGLEPVRFSRRRTRPEDDKNLLLQRRAGAEATDENDEAAAQADVYESLPPRPPVVCIMGHVDHGKTTLMDALRQRSKGFSASDKTTKKKKSKNRKNASPTKDGAVAGTEAGGITQVISAFQVPLENQDNAVTFLDTPGHAAFRAMRESGSNAADVIVLVVAADDGVSAQTVEIINFYKSIVKGSGGGGISMVVAMTKIDKHGIDVNESRQRIENQLLEHGILSESFRSSGESEYGPPVQVIPVSGLTGEGLDDLIEGLVLQSEIMDLRADEKAQAEGIVMDARMEKGVGVVADCVIRWGSLERGNVIVSGVHSGKVKALKDMNGVTIKTGVPSQPVRILGFKSLPKAGDPIVCVHSEEVADQITERRQALQDAEQSSRTTATEAAEMQVMGTAAKRGSSMEATLVKYGQDGDANDSQIRIPVILRADGEGSLAALRESLVAVGDESSFDLVIDPVNSGIGAVSANDVRMAVESGASIFSFGVKQNDKAALAMAEAEGVEIRSHDVIYSLLDDAKDVFAEHLPAKAVEVVHGRAKVQAIFDVNNKKDAERIAGLAVLDGILYKGKAKGTNGERMKCHYRVLRNGQLVSDSESLDVSSLRKVKEDVESVRRGEECGLALLDYTDYEKGDIIECYSIELKREFV